MPIQALACPNCGAALDAQPGETAVVCKFCGSNIRISGDSQAVPFFETPAPPSQVDVAEVRRQLAANQKIAAIKYVRENAALGLKEAKDYVDALERGENPPLPPARPNPHPPMGKVDWKHVRALLDMGNKVVAIKYYREQTGKGLKESKDAVEAFESSDTEQAQGSSFTGQADWDVIRALVARGQKLEAIKMYRNQTGADFEQARQAIEATPEYQGPARNGRAAGQPWGCAWVLLSITLLIFALLASCGLYYRTTELHACAANTIASNGDIREMLGDPITTGLPWVLGYSSSSDFGGNSEQQAGYYLRARGAHDNRLFYVNAYRSSSDYYSIRINPFPNREDLFITSSGELAACLGNR